VSYRIHPAIGIARVGDSDEYYIAPEREGALPSLPDGRTFTPEDFRDRRKRIRRQGARFEVYRYDSGDPSDPGKPVRAGEDGVARVEWRVHLANKKPTWYRYDVTLGEGGYAPDHALRNAEVTDPRRRTKFIIDPGPRTLTGPGQSVEMSRSDNPDGYPMTFPPRGLRPWKIDTLGGLRTDEEGRLIVLGGHGHSGTTATTPEIVDYANNDNWWDDTSDGPVTARIVMRNGKTVEVDTPAWVVVAPPKFVPQLVNLVTLYDAIFDVSVRTMGLRPDIYRDGFWQQDYKPAWDTEIEPILRRAHLYRWVSAIPPHPHDFDFAKLGDPDPTWDGLRGYYLQLVRPPDFPNLGESPDTGHQMMPFLCGDNCLEPGAENSDWATLTGTQYFFLQQWAAGKFVRRRSERVGPGGVLDRAILENCVGAAFCPGIEATWICRDPSIYAAPFRIRHKADVGPPLSLGQDFEAGLEPGDLSRYMACPWQADFNECSQSPIGDRFVWWWPVQRPSYVYVAEGGRMRQVPWVGSGRDQNADDYVQFGDDLDMVKLWHELGFVFDEGTESDPRFVEVERVLPRHHHDAS
jgi:hypothetical protein